MGTKEASSGCLWAAIEARKGADAVSAEALAALDDALTPGAGGYEAVVAVLTAAHVECSRSNVSPEGFKVRLDKMPLVGGRVGRA